MGKLVRLTEKIASTPQLMAPTAMEGILSYLHSRNDVEVQFAIEGGRVRDSRELSYNPDTGVGLLSIDGPLTYLEYEPMCGAEPSSYQRLTSEFKALVNAGAETIVLDIDSPGGEAYACFETAKELRQMADANGVKILAYVDGLAASAAYGLACIADEIIVNPMAEVGSIGVVVGLVNYSGAEKNFGIERTYVYAGDSKIPFDAEGKFTESFLADIQAKVDTLYGEFVSHVVEARGLSVEAVKDTQAKVFTATKAIELGLADSVMTIAEFQTYLADFSEGKTNMSVGKRLFSLSTGDDMSKVTELEAQVTSLNAELESFKTLEAEHTSLVAQLAAVSGELETAKGELADFREKAEAVQAEAAQMKEDSRKAALTAVVGSEQAEALFTSLNVLDDAAFELVVGSYKASAAAVDESALFQEIGAGSDGEQDVDAGYALVGQMIQNSKKTQA